jgi:hypothetical protein
VAAKFERHRARRPDRSSGVARPATGINSAAPAPRPLLEQVRDVLRVRRYAQATEDAYLNWIRRFILFHDKRHPLEMGEAEIEGYLTYLAVECEVAASTQNATAQPGPLE